MVLDREFPPDIRVENEIDILRSSGVDVSLLAMTREGRPQHESAEPGLQIFRAPISELVYKSSVACLKFPTYFNFWRAAIRNVRKRTTVDAIHVHDLPLAKVGLEFAREAGIPLVLDLHENWPYMLDDATHTNTFLGRLLSSPQQWQAYEESMVRSADLVVTVADEMRQRIVDLGASRDDVFVYQNVPDLRLRAPSGPKVTTETFHLYYAGGITRQRGLQVAMDAIALGRDAGNAVKNLKFTVLGSGRYLDTLRQQVERLAIQDQVEFMGWQSQETVMSKLATADLAIVPHIRSVQNDHSSPNKIFQYMLSGTPVLSSDCRSLKRVIEESGAGLTYQHDSPQSLLDRLAWAIDHRSELDEMGRKGREAVETRYNTGVERQNLVNAYSQLGLL